jgi:FAD/FMN-containing dehydrogenase
MISTRRAVVAAAPGLLLAGRAAAAQGLVLNDASGLNPTPVAVSVAVGTGAARLAGLRRELKAAADARRPVAMGGARHSMGGQSLARLGSALTLDAARPEVDSRAGVYRVDAGLRWRDVIAALAPLGFSPKVMQSNHDFSIGGTFSVNAHGWPAPFGPMGSTVRAVRIMLADGTVVEASRQARPELFALAMGGYGLFGVILDLDVEMTANVALTPEFALTPAPDLAGRFTAAVAAPSTISMAYARLSVARDHFLEEALLVTYRPLDEPPPKRRTGTGPSVLDGLTRSVYRSQVGSEPMKSARWYAETVLAPKLHPRVVSRSALLDTAVSDLASKDRRRTDILHEYFLPPQRLEAFLAACRRAIPDSGIELLNVTLRYLAPDTTSVMRFARGPRIAAVMSFSQLKTGAAEQAMAALTSTLVDAAIGQGGSYYLPYRLHAGPDQLRRAYPETDAFAAAKRRFDPGLLFRNALWDRYLA